MTETSLSDHGIIGDLHTAALALRIHSDLVVVAC